MGIEETLIPYMEGLTVILMVGVPVGFVGMIFYLITRD